MRIVLDTNILVSAVLNELSIPAKVHDIAKKRHTILTSAETYAELKEVLSRKKFNPYISFTSRGKFLSKFFEMAEMVESSEKITACRDPKDNMLLELAVSGNADLIITGDQDLLVLNPFRKIQIVTPAQFLEIVEKL